MRRFHFSKRQDFQFFSALVLCIAISACSGDSSKSFAIFGESYCDEINQIVDLASQHHLTTSNERLAQVYDQSMNQTWDTLIEVLRGRDLYSSLADQALAVKERKESFLIENLTDCKDLKEIEALFQIEQESVFQDERAPYWVFLKRFAESLDYFSHYSPPSISSLEQAEEEFHYGVKLDLNLVTHFSHVQKTAKVLAVSDKDFDIEVGDEILAVDIDENDPELSSIEELSKKHRAREFHITLIDQLFNKSARSSIRISYMKRDDPQREIKQSKLHGRPSKGFHLFETPSVIVEVKENILFVRLFEFAANSYSQLLAKIAELDEESRRFEAIILDLRFNPGGSVFDAIQIAALFLPETVVGSVISRTAPHSDSPDDFSHLGLRYKEEPLMISPSTKTFNQPMIVLANDHSASSSDILTQILSETRRAYFVGTGTFGKGIGQITQSLGPISKLGGHFKMTTLQFVGPSGETAQLKGVSPDWYLPDPLVEKLIEECKRDKALLCSPLKMQEISLEKTIAPIPSRHLRASNVEIPNEMQTRLSKFNQDFIAPQLNEIKSRLSANPHLDLQREAAVLLLKTQIKNNPSLL